MMEKNLTFEGYKEYAIKHIVDNVYGTTEKEVREYIEKEIDYLRDGYNVYVKGGSTNPFRGGYIETLELSYGMD